MNFRDEKKITSPWPVLVVLFIVFPPLGLLGIVALLAYKAAKKRGQANDGTFRAAKERFLRRLKEEDAAERPYQSRPHGHTPQAYSYDACAQTKRLEQLKVLKSAGLLDEVEYQQRRQEILQ